MTTRSRRKTRKGFTLLEVLIAMSILAVGATSVLGIFVAALRFHTDRVEDNRITGLLNHAKTHAWIAFNNHIPDPDKGGDALLPKKIVADFTDADKALANPDPMIQDAAERFEGFRYEIEFEDSDVTVPGSSVVVTISIFRRSTQKDKSTPFDKLVLTRDGTPVNEFFSSPSLAKRDSKKDTQGRGGSR